MTPGFQVVFVQCNAATGNLWCPRSVLLRHMAENAPFNILLEMKSGHARCNPECRRIKKPIKKYVWGRGEERYFLVFKNLISIIAFAYIEQALRAWRLKIDTYEIKEIKVTVFSGD